MITKLEVGSKVKIVNTMNISNSNIREGMTAKIIDLDYDSRGAILEFDTMINGHDGRELGKSGHCWWVKSKNFELDNQEDERMENKNGIAIGDKVVVVGDSLKDSIKVGMEGVVNHIHEVIPHKIGVKFSENIGGHDLDGGVEYGYGWYVPAEALEVVNKASENSNKEEFTVTIEGKRTTVTLADGSVGTSKPIDKDEYSLEKGILIAKEKAHFESKKGECDLIIGEAEEIAGQVNELEGQLIEKAKSFIELQLEMAHHQAEVLRIGG